LTSAAVVALSRSADEDGSWMTLPPIIPRIWLTISGYIACCSTWLA
jgi:hypothetical protein